MNKNVQRIRESIGSKNVKSKFNPYVTNSETEPYQMPEMADSTEGCCWN